MKKSYIFIGSTALDLIILDQLSKWIAIKSFQTPHTFTDWFSFEYAENPGIAFGLAIPPELIIPLNILLLGGIIIYGIKELNMKSPWTIASMGMIIGGAIGNIIDRIVHGHVIDFIRIGQWPTFNLADSFLTVGIFLIILFYAKIKRV